MIKPNQPNKLVGFFHGIDPATKGDYYTNYVHALTEKPRVTSQVRAEDFKWIPFAVNVIRLKKRDPNEIMDIQIRQFNKFPPMLVTIDASREDFLASALQRKYGESRIKALKFVNSGQSNVKFKLKQIGHAYIHAGYEWPDVNLLEKNYPRMAKLFRLTKKEMMYEIVTSTESGKVTFKHPIGKHNDLVHAWEMSLLSVMDFQKKNLGYQKREISSPEYKIVLEEIYKKRAQEMEDNEEDPVLYRRRTLYDVPWRMPP